MASENLPGESRAYQIQVPCIVFFVLTPLFVAIRIWARVKLRGMAGLGWDDWTILASWVFATTVSALMMAACTYGFGQHIANLSRPNKLMTLKLYYVAQAFYKLTIDLTKISILLLYLRIFIKKWFRRACWTLMVIILLYMVATTTVSIRQCGPVARAWDKTIPGECIDITANWYANAAFSVATDIFILGLPMYPIYTSQLPASQKIALVVVFGLGSFTTVTSILRMTTLSFSSTSPDTTFDMASSIWTMIEQNFAIICACLPVCRLPLSYIFPTQFSSPSGSSSAGGLKQRSVDSCSSSESSSTTRPRPGTAKCTCTRQPTPPGIVPVPTPAFASFSAPKKWPIPALSESQLEKDIVEIPESQAAGWITDDEPGENVVSHASVTPWDEPACARHSVRHTSARGIHMMTHYSITYDVEKADDNVGGGGGR
ncbi:hypothetical protein B0H63DRAFT_30854 [Podospora didyma]|uniref:Rhodopsin domain-containing protein n=1 Tax=Podospora didyma TaxID=330526 RepID=A0AAE0P5Z5_9PEZI|nr:hypothetical protein B0H63DRAFT_30854 [Podospora didyma]